MQFILPDTQWQHITFTMPSQLWELFELNRSFLLKQLSRLAADTVLKIAKKKGVVPGIFTALHTFGRDLKWNTHIHLSTTLGGLSDDATRYVKLYFEKGAIERQWKYLIITLLRNNFDQMILPKHLQRVCPDYHHFNRWLDMHYQKKWIVHFSKPSDNHRRNVKYLGSYIKRPPLSMSRLKHYDGHTVRFEYLDHKNKKKNIMTMDALEFMQRFIKHIPDKHFRLINYYGFLANRVRGSLLPKVYALLGQEEKNDIPTLRYGQMLKSSFGVDPHQCILCNSRMAFVGLKFGMPMYQLRHHHVILANAKPIPEAA